MPIVEETLILCVFEGAFWKHVTVFLAGKNVYRIKKFQRGAKFVDTKIVRRNSIGSNLVSANSVTPYIIWKKGKNDEGI